MSFNCHLFPPFSHNIFISAPLLSSISFQSPFLNRISFLLSLLPHVILFYLSFSFSVQLLPLFLSLSLTAYLFPPHPFSLPIPFLLYFIFLSLSTPTSSLPTFYYSIFISTSSFLSSKLPPSLNCLFQHQHLLLPLSIITYPFVCHPFFLLLLYFIFVAIFNTRLLSLSPLKLIISLSSFLCLPFYLSSLSSLYSTLLKIKYLHLFLLLLLHLPSFNYPASTSSPCFPSSPSSSFQPPPPHVLSLLLLLLTPLDIVSSPNYFHRLSSKLSSDVQNKIIFSSAIYYK